MSTAGLSVESYLIRMSFLFTSIEELVYVQLVAHQSVLECHVSYVQST